MFVSTLNTKFYSITSEFDKIIPYKVRCTQWQSRYLCNGMIDLAENLQQWYRIGIFIAPVVQISMLIYARLMKCSGGREWTDECEKADALCAGAPAAEKADCNDDWADDDEDESHVVEHEQRVSGVVTQQDAVEQRFTVDVQPDSGAEHRTPAHLPRTGHTLSWYIGTHTTKHTPSCQRYQREPDTQCKTVISAVACAISDSPFHCEFNFNHRTVCFYRQWLSGLFPKKLRSWARSETDICLVHPSVGQDRK